MAAHKMIPVYAIATHAVSALGINTESHWHAVTGNRTGIRQHHDQSLADAPFWGAVIDPQPWQLVHAQTTSWPLTAFEKMAVYSALHALEQLEQIIDLNETVFILSTTKGNIELLGEVPDEKIGLMHSAEAVSKALAIPAKPVVISHACVSGVVALQYAQALLQSGKYKNAIVTGCDRFSKFVLSGFQSFHAVADGPCKPFDVARSGINLGEAAATIVLSTELHNEPLAQLLSGATSNDANHISGPSRTGEELGLAISKALSLAGLQSSDIDMISAHGTATLYNDEMESKAFDMLGMNNVPLHSLKGFVGHTLGAAGVLESVMIIESLRHQQLIPSAGFENLGVPKSLNITRSATNAKINYALKTASGFGGCNATAVWKAADL
ncbi:beta-ketoacyl-[acyl-carrier-protein] synthase family protein [Taibaiella soli]|nr:beta-ketoacyl synthase N-terminal-like domain-containing protein [Taibaiella soli]